MPEDPNPILGSISRTVENAIEEALDEGARIDDLIIYINCILTAAVLRRNVSTSVLAEVYRDAADAIEEGFELAPKAYREN